MLKDRFADGMMEAGCDEAGRGCLAGPVYAAAVILPSGFYHPLLNDSKQVTVENREVLRPIIEANAIAWAVSSCDNYEIDKINILKASFKAMHMAIGQLQVIPQLLLIDGHIFPAYMGIPHRCIVRGDATYMSIAAASILAKTHRDEFMNKVDLEYPAYHWHENKGYGTAAHRKAIKEFGLTSYHRTTFGICKEAMAIVKD